jgi:uncharacterized protein YjbI with pentapeptide repeats
MKEGDFEQCNFSESILVQANFDRACIQNAILTDAVLDRAIMTNIRGTAANIPAVQINVP